MKFYNYKNGEIAFFENNERMLISKNEKEMLVTGTEPFAGEPIYSILADYIYLKIGDRFSKTAFFTTFGLNSSAFFSASASSCIFL